jgi:hypothetical protein
MASGHDNHTDVMIGGLQELLVGLVSRKPIEQAIVAVESGDGAFRWIGAKGGMGSGGGGGTDTFLHCQHR